MDLEDEKVVVLSQLGLTALQAKVYLSLGRLGDASIKLISKSAHVDRAGAYRGLYQLQEIGLVERLLTAPVSFRAIPLSEGLQILLKRKSVEYCELETKATEIAQKIESVNNEVADDDEYEFLFVPENEAMLRRFHERYDRAHVSYDAIACYEVFRYALNEDINFRKSVERGIRLRFLTNRPENECVLADKPLILGISGSFEVRFVPKSALRMFGIIDGKEAFLGTSKGSYAASLKHPAALWSNNENFVSLLRDYFDGLWLKAEKAYS